MKKVIYRLRLLDSYEYKGYKLKWVGGHNGHWGAFKHNKLVYEGDSRNELEKFINAAIPKPEKWVVLTYANDNFSGPMYKYRSGNVGFIQSEAKIFSSKKEAEDNLPKQGKWEWRAVKI